MPGRRYSHGLHQAIEAKENVEVKRESKTLATVSFQITFAFLINWPTGTAATESEEFYRIYGLTRSPFHASKVYVRITPMYLQKP